MADPGGTLTANTEVWDGTSWTEVANLNTALGEDTRQAQEEHQHRRFRIWWLYNCRSCKYRRHGMEQLGQK